MAAKDRNGKQTTTLALEASHTWLHFWEYKCPGCLFCDPTIAKGKARGKQAAGNAVEWSSREQRKYLQNALWKTLERHEKRAGAKGYNGFGGGKGWNNSYANNNGFGWPVQKQAFQKGNDKGGKKGKGKSKNQGKKDQQKNGGGWW